MGHLSASGFPVLVIDDGSTDDTGTIAEVKGATVIHHDHKKGKGHSLREGFDYALLHHYDGVITMDGDGQHDVKDLDRFIQVATKHKSSIIVGNRMTNTEGMPCIRYCTNRFMSWLISLACRRTIADTQCGYRYISCEVLRNINLTCRDFEIETEILMKASKEGYAIYDVPIKTIYRNEVSKINPFKDTIRFLIYFVKEIRFLRK